MPRFFVDSSDIAVCGSAVTVTVRGEDAAHITRALRMKAGENVTVCDENGREYLTAVSSVGDEVVLNVISSRESENEPPYRATVYQALVKGDRFDTVLQKATELGATDFVPIITSRCVVSLEPKEYAKKLERWKKIVREAAKQCGRAMIPAVHEPEKFSSAIEAAARADLPLFCYEGDGTVSISELTETDKAPKTVSVVIGPEGGFSEEEARFADSRGMKMTGLGKRILRTETAAPFVLSCISFRYEL